MGFTIRFFPNLRQREERRVAKAEMTYVVLEALNCNFFVF